jgi:hypothetical protein
MRFIRLDETGQSRDLWHIWNMLGMLRQLALCLSYGARSRRRAP